MRPPYTQKRVCVCLFRHEYFGEGYLPDGLIDRLRSIVTQEKNKFRFLFKLFGFFTHDFPTVSCVYCVVVALWLWLLRGRRVQRSPTFLSYTGFYFYYDFEYLSACVCVCVCCLTLLNKQGVAASQRERERENNFVLSDKDPIRIPSVNLQSFTDRIFVFLSSTHTERERVYRRTDYVQTHQIQYNLNPPRSKPQLHSALVNQ